MIQRTDEINKALVVPVLCPVFDSHGALSAEGCGMNSGALVQRLLPVHEKKKVEGKPGYPRRQHRVGQWQSICQMNV